MKMKTKNIGELIIDEIIKQGMFNAEVQPDGSFIFLWAANAFEQLEAVVHSNSLYQREIASGLRLENPPDLSATEYVPCTDSALLLKKIEWVNALRAVVSRRMPRNKCGVPIISDVDLLLATESEREEALEVLMKRK